MSNRDGGFRGNSRLSGGFEIGDEKKVKKKKLLEGQNCLMRGKAEIHRHEMLEGGGGGDEMALMKKTNQWTGKGQKKDT